MANDFALTGISHFYNLPSLQGKLKDIPNLLAKAVLMVAAPGGKTPFLRTRQ